MLKLEYFGATEKGRRASNEDNFLVFKNNYGFIIAIIADGMGGHEAGEVASKSVIKMAKQEMIDINFNNLNEEQIKEVLLTIIRNFQKKLKKVGNDFPQYSDMGSTLNMNLFVNDKMYTINIGDSRTQSFFKKDLIKITEDHNLATLAEKDERYSHYKGQTNMLTSSLGPNKNTTADFFVTKLKEKKGYILMTTDGVHNSISDIG